MMNRCAQTELIAFEVKRCQEAHEGQRELVEWPLKNKHLNTCIYVHSLKCMNVCIESHSLLQYTNMVWVWNKFKAFGHCFSAKDLSWQELCCNLFQAWRWCKYFPPTSWFGFYSSWKTFHTVLLEWGMWKLFLKSPSCFQLGSAAL